MASSPRYDEDFKKSLVALFNNGKTQTALSKEYGVSLSALGKWIRLYSEIKTDDGEILTAKQIKDLQKRNAQLEEEKPHLKKSDCHFHATLRQRLDAIYKLRFQHNIKTLCRVLRVNRSTYYKHFSTIPAPRIKENQEIAKKILQIYSHYDKRLGAYKIAFILERDYGTHISVGRVYRLMQTLDDKLKRIVNEYGLSEDKAVEMMRKVDKKRQAPLFLYEPRQHLYFHHKLQLL